MASTAREFLLIVQESALGTPVASPVIGTNSIFIRLVDGNAFSMVAEPVQMEIAYGGGLAKTSEIVSDHYQLQGTLKTVLYASQAQFLLNWAAQEINTAQTVPWTTTELPADLVSCSIYHAIRMNDGTFLKKVYSGAKVSSWQIQVSRQSTYATISIGITACTQTGIGTLSGDPTTLLPTPTETQMPLGPYTFAQTAGGLTVGGVARTQYGALTIAVQNALDGQWFESAGLSILNYHGRKSKLNADLYLKVTPDDRSAYEASTAGAASVVFTNGVTGQNLTLQFNGQNKITKLPYDLPLNTAFLQKLELTNVFDQSAAQDISFSFA